jgi:HPt (histidine-containing phosphotransfer) domain-containing protein
MVLPKNKLKNGMGLQENNMKLTYKELLSLLLNDIADFLEELTLGNLDSFNIMEIATKLLSLIKGE